MAEVIDTALEMIERRIAELEPAAKEYERLISVRAAMQRDSTDSIVGNPPYRKPLEVRQAEIVAFIQANPGCRVVDVAKAQGITGARATQILNTMEARGLIKRTPDGSQTRLVA